MNYFCFLLETRLVIYIFFFTIRVPDFSRYNIPKRGEINQIATKLPNGFGMYQMAKEYTNLFHSKHFKIYPNWDFGLKINHLATRITITL
jgi:hypothetical protein